MQNAWKHSERFRKVHSRKAIPFSLVSVVLISITNAFFLVNASSNLCKNILWTIFNENSYSEKTTLKAVMYSIHQQKRA